MTFLENTLFFICWNPEAVEELGFHFSALSLCYVNKQQTWERHQSLHPPLSKKGNNLIFQNVKLHKLFIKQGFWKYHSCSLTMWKYAVPITAPQSFQCKRSKNDRTFWNTFSSLSLLYLFKTEQYSSTRHLAIHANWAHPFTVGPAYLEYIYI